jgi:hypothetical protein
MPLGANKAAIMGVAGTAVTGDVVLLSSQTASDDASISFTSGIDSTYGEYIFRFYNMNPVTNGARWQFQASTDGGSTYATTTTNTVFQAFHNEAGDSYTLGIETSTDQAEGTAYNNISYNIGAESDESLAGELHVFNPSSTTYAKNYYSKTQQYHNSDYSMNTFHAGYYNTTSAIDAFDFKFHTGNFDGTIKMWGVK